MTKTILLLIAALALSAENPAKPEALGVEEQLKIRNAQLRLARAGNAKKQLEIQWAAAHKEEAEAQEAFAKLLSALVKPKTCQDCVLNEELSWVKPPPEKKE